MRHSAFVTGATGFVGGNLVRELHRQNWEVTALVRTGSSTAEISDLPVNLVTGDIVDARSVRRAMPLGVDAVFHVAASTNVWSGNNDTQDRINIGGTREVIEASVAANVKRLIYTSSFTVWGFQDTTLTEHSPRTTASDWINYVRTKHVGEELVKDAAARGRLDAVILNPAHILGPGDRNNWSKMISMVQRRKLPGVPTGGGAFADVREVAKAHVQAFHRGECGENYLLGGQEVSFMEVIRITGDILGKPVPHRTTPAWLLKATARLNAILAHATGKEPVITPESAVMISHFIRCNSSRAERELAYRFTPIRVLVRDTINWMKQAGLLE